MTTTAVTTDTWAIDPSHTEIGFAVRHLVSKVRGKFETFEGAIVGAEDITASTVHVSVDLASVNTGTADRDAHLRSGDFFNAEENPKMTFVSTGITAKGDNEFVVTGDLTIKGIPSPLTSPPSSSARALTRGAARVSASRPRRRSAARSSASTSTSPSKVPTS